jgi:Cu2+-exporting ATPase
LRPDAREAVGELAARSLSAEVLSGDEERAVADVARRLAIPSWRSRLMPGEKVERIRELSDQGARVLMVGDGINDAPSLAAAHASIAPASAADIGRSAADFIFLRDSLAAVPLALEVARRAGRLIRENFAIAILYNVVAVPMAVLGYVTPLIAAIAMSGSSILVVTNSMRLLRGGGTSAEDLSVPLAMEPAE